MPNTALHLPPAAQAYDTILNRVHTAQFRQKLASRGYPVQTQEDLARAMSIAGRLRNVQQDEAVKLAAAESIFAVGEAQLDALISGGAGPSDVAVKLAAAELAGDPEIYASAVSLLTNSANAN